jgi:hypothetical protein
MYSRFSKFIHQKYRALGLDKILQNQRFKKISKYSNNIFIQPTGNQTCATFIMENVNCNMPVNFNIRVTKLVLEKSKYCSSEGHDQQMIGEHCAIAVALKDLFPDVYVSGNNIHPFGFNATSSYYNLSIELPQVAKDFIKVFDSLCKMPSVRCLLPEFDFDISIPENIIAEIRIDEIKRLAESGSMIGTTAAQPSVVL